MPSSTESPSATTRQARIAADLAEMLSGIISLEGGTSAEILDRLIRPEITKRFERIKPTVEAIRQAKAQHRKGA